MPTEAEEFPIIVMDDDQWMYVYASLDQLMQDAEPSFLDDVTAAFDGRARALQLSLDESGEEIRIEVKSSDPQLERLQSCVEEFFAAWTHGAPPERLNEPRQYTQSVLSTYALRRDRRRKNS
ncbi:hypothetical protein [Streptomyces mirabilis]|uniref:hypothetical protein n=1 Tax=Streptomyces mirabilis TaxID=68239 RepID=UPI0037F6DC4A